MQDPGTEEAIKRWDLSAKLYAAYCSKYGNTNKKVLLTPVILEMLGRVVGRNVLDAGCGEGFLSRLMAERGASVTAVDYSGRLLEIARERTADDLRIDYLHVNLEHLDMLNDDTFASGFRQQSYRLPPDADKLLQNDHWHGVYGRRLDGALPLSGGNRETSPFHRRFAYEPLPCVQVEKVDGVSSLSHDSLV